MFLDEAVVTFASGKGGSGAVAFHREKHVPRGGPNGADGGRGGDIILIADRHRRTLYDFSLLDHYESPDGTHGLGNKRGKDSKDVTIKIPVGTQIFDAETDELIVDMDRNEKKVVLCKGGRGGFGNQHYVSSVRQAPNFAQKGEPGETKQIRLSLKLIADIGLVGLPNAGKSTLISRISAAKPKIADYPFTTIVPNLGVVAHRLDTFVVADMPGLIKGASEGIGLGHQFLKHVERNRVLVHVVEVLPIDESDPVQNYRTIESELENYSAEIFERPRIIALNKVDLISEERLAELKEAFAGFGRPVFAISGVTGVGLDDLLNEMHDELDRQMPEETVILTPTIKLNDDDSWEVVREADGEYRVKGKRMERMVAMTDLENRDALRYLYRRLNRIGVIDELRKQGVAEGDDVTIGEFEFAYTDLQ
ncbi:GTPase ObgE [bacterium]|nr:MAG: GTPase ObgE [bacterium]